MSCDSGTTSPKTGEKSVSAQHRLPKCLFLGSHENCVGELTLDASTLKEVWGDEPVTLALASMLKAVLEGRVSSEKVKEDTGDAAKDADEQKPSDDMVQARLALMEVFECFSADMIPTERPIHVLDIDSLLARQHELSEARKTATTTSSAAAVKEEGNSSEGSSTAAASTAQTEDANGTTNSGAAPSPSTPSSVSSSSSGEGPESGPMTAEEEMLSVLLNLVYAIRKKHRVHSPPSSGEGSDSGNDDSLTFGIVDPDLSSCPKSDFDKEWLLVCRETKKKRTPENGIYPIQSIYSFFLVLNSDDFSRSSSQSPSSDSSDNQDSESPEDKSSDSNDGDDDADTVSVSPDEVKDTPEKSVSPPQDNSKSSLFLAVKKHEESAWSVLAALHEEGFDTIAEEDDDENSTRNAQYHIPDVTVIVDPLRIIGEYIRYLQGEEAPPRSEQRKRRRVHVHESTIERTSCKIRILTPYDEDDDGDTLSPTGHQENREQYLQDKMVREQEELRKLLEQKLRELQQSIEQASQEEEDHQETTSPSPEAAASSAVS